MLIVVIMMQPQSQLTSCVEGRPGRIMQLKGKSLDGNFSHIIARKAQQAITYYIDSTLRQMTLINPFFSLSGSFSQTKVYV